MLDREARVRATIVPRSTTLMSLRIPQTVTRCATPDRQGRVRYEDGVTRVIGENIVLRRWRQRGDEPRARAASETFDGLRLRPGTWTLLLACQRYGLRLDAAIDVERLTRCLEQARRDHPKCGAAHPSKLVHLLRFLQQRRVLRAVAERARNPEKPGLPDLFLYRLNAEGEVFGGRFVESAQSRPEGERRLPD
jgi:hypothetical protein